MQPLSSFCFSVSHHVHNKYSDNQNSRHILTYSLLWNILYFLLGKWGSGFGLGKASRVRQCAPQSDGQPPRGFAKPASEKLSTSMKIILQSRICPLLLSNANVVSALSCDCSLPPPEGGGLISWEGSRQGEVTHLGFSSEVGTVNLAFVHLGSRPYNSKTKFIFRKRKTRKLCKSYT